MSKPLLGTLLLGLLAGSTSLACSASPIGEEPSGASATALTRILPSTPLGQVDRASATKGIDQHLEAPGRGVLSLEPTADSLRVHFADGVDLDVRGDANSQTVTDAAGNVVYSATQTGDDGLRVTYGGRTLSLTASDKVGDLHAFLQAGAEQDMHPVAALTEFARFVRASQTGATSPGTTQPRVVGAILWGAVIVGGIIVVTQFVVTGLSWTANDYTTALAQCTALQTGSGSTQAINNYLNAIANADAIKMIGATGIAAGTQNPPLPWVCLSQGGQMTVQQNGSIVSGAANGYERNGSSTNGKVYQLISGQATIQYPTGFYGWGPTASVTCNNIPLAIPFNAACVVPPTEDTAQARATFCQNAALAGVSCVSEGYPLQSGVISIRPVVQE